MTRITASLQVAFAISCIIILAEPAAAQYAYVTISVPQYAKYGAIPTGVNDAGTVVGYYFDQNYHGHGFIWTGGNNFTSFDFQGAVEGTYPGGINDAGIIVGAWYDAYGNEHGFQGTLGNFSSFDAPGAACGGTQPAAINSGESTGIYWDANCDTLGFIDNHGTFTTLEFPGAAETVPNGINDSGQVVGIVPGSGGGWMSFLYIGGNFSTVTLPGGSSFQASGIDDSGDIAGNAWVSGFYQGALLASGKVIPIYPPGNPSDYVFGVSSSGTEITGYDSQGPFLASAYSLLDPYPNLMSGPSVSGDLLASQGLNARVVQAVAADGVTQVVVRVPAANVGDQISITLYNDQGYISSSPPQDGGLGNPGDSSFTQNQITVSAIAVSGPNGSQPFGFAIYQAPVDFARRDPYQQQMTGVCNGGTPSSGTDDQLQCRTVSLQVQDLTTGTSGTFPITILRPPVVLVHGLWSNLASWDNFSPLITSSGAGDPRFLIVPVSYDDNVGLSISASDPPYSPPLLQNAKANSLGFAYNAPDVLDQAKMWIKAFRYGMNPVQLASAAVQADIVAHSMGGDVARALVLARDFLADPTFGQGYIHKLITIGTPHLGSPLAGALLLPQERGRCVQTKLAEHGKFAFSSVSLVGTGLVSGAIGDLVPGSAELSALGSQSPHPLPTAFIVATNPVFSPLPVPPIIGVVCSLEGDYLGGVILGGTGNLFGEQNDAIVGETSAQNGLGPGTGFVFSGVVHSTGAEWPWGLGYLPPAMLEYPPISSQVINVLNTPLWEGANGRFYFLNP